MNIDNLKRANLIINKLIPNVNELINMSLKSKSNNTVIADSIYELSKYDKEFNSKFNQLLLETKQRFQKEFNEL